jgi:hypothetical protein
LSREIGNRRKGIYAYAFLRVVSVFTYSPFGRDRAGATKNPAGWSGRGLSLRAKIPTQHKRDDGEDADLYHLKE